MASAPIYAYVLDIAAGLTSAVDLSLRQVRAPLALAAQGVENISCNMAIMPYIVIVRRRAGDHQEHTMTKTSNNAKTPKTPTKRAPAKGKPQVPAVVPKPAPGKGAATPAGLVMQACVIACAARLEAESRKGAALTAAHGLLDNGGLAAADALDYVASKAREEAGGKAAPKHVQGGYKLAKRYAAIARGLEHFGFTFAAVGELVAEKTVFTVNLAESALRTVDADDASTSAVYAREWQSAGGTVAERCTFASMAVDAAVEQERAAFKAAMREAILAELAAEGVAPAAKPATKRTRVPAKDAAPATV